jgi:arsenate reductase (thioredoxin)
MRELGIEICGQRSKSADKFSDQQFDYVLTVCDKAKEGCPIFPGQTVRIHQSVTTRLRHKVAPTRGSQPFRCVRDELRKYLSDFLRSGDSERTTSLLPKTSSAILPNAAGFEPARGPDGS